MDIEILKDYHPNGQIRLLCERINGVECGNKKLYFESGQIKWLFIKKIILL
jgi:antitoxin component YwqK of YwqJK toxin-antitoxin module